MERLLSARRRARWRKRCFRHGWCPAWHGGHLRVDLVCGACRRLLTELHQRESLIPDRRYLRTQREVRGWGDAVLEIGEHHTAVRAAEALPGRRLVDGAQRVDA